MKMNLRNLHGFTARIAFGVSLAVLAFLSPARASLLTLTNLTALNQPDTNIVKVTTADPNHPTLTDGTVITIGLPVRVQPDSNGVFSVFRLTGNYLITGPNYGLGLLYRFPDNSSNATAIKKSGFNTYEDTTIIINTNISSSIPLISGTNTSIRNDGTNNHVDIPPLTFDPYGAADNAITNENDAVFGIVSLDGWTNNNGKAWQSGGEIHANKFSDGTGTVPPANVIMTNGALLAGNALTQVANIAANITPPNTNEIWISPVGTPPGLGTQTVPYVATNAAQLDAILINPTDPHAIPHLVPENSTIHLSAGLFHADAGIAMHTGWRIVGAGMAATTVILDPLTYNYGYAVFGYDLGFLPNNFGTNFTTGMKNMSVEDLTVDSNVQNQVTNTACHSAVMLTGDNSLIYKVRVVNGGSTHSGEEQFLLSIVCLGGNFYGAVQTNITHNAVIDGCVIGPMANVALADGCSAFVIYGSGFRGNTSNSAATTLEFPATLSVTNGWIVGAEVRNCSIEGTITTGSSSPGSPTYFHAAGIGPYVAGMKIHNNSFANIVGGADSTAIYGELGPYQDLTIEDNYFYNVGNGVFQRNSESYAKKNIIIRNNFIRYAGANSRGIYFQGGNPQGTNPITGLVIEGNNIGLIASTNASQDGINLYCVSNAVVQNNFVSTTNYQASVNTNSTILRWFNNWNDAGTNLTQDPAFTFYANALTLDSVTVTTLTGNIPLLALTNVFNGTTGVNGAGITNLSFAGNKLNQTLSFTGGTNVQIDLSAYTNAAQLSFTLSATTNVWFLPITNAFAGVSFNVEIQQTAQFTVGFSTNNSAGCATWVPPSFGQFISLPTNSTASRQFLGVIIGGSGTNACFNQFNITR